MNEIPDEDLLARNIISGLRECGHFLYFKIGDKGGRRRIFSVLLQHGELPQRELQDILGIQSGSLSELLSKTEADGYIVKTKSETDKRNYNLKLTEKGKIHAKKMQAIYIEKVTTLLECYSVAEQQEFYALLNTLLQHWKSKEVEEGLVLAEKHEQEIIKIGE